MTRKKGLDPQEFMVPCCAGTPRACHSRKWRPRLAHVFGPPALRFQALVSLLHLTFSIWGQTPKVQTFKKGSWMREVWEWKEL